MTDKTFTCAGVSLCGGKLKVRYANSMERIRTLIRTGHTGIEMFDFAEPMRKEDLVDKLLSVTFANPEYMDVVKRTAVEKYGFIIPGYEAKRLTSRRKFLHKSAARLLCLAACKRQRSALCRTVSTGALPKSKCAKLQ